MGDIVKFHPAVNLSQAVNVYLKDVQITPNRRETYFISYSGHTCMCHLIQPRKIELANIFKHLALPCVVGVICEWICIVVQHAGWNVLVLVPIYNFA